MSAPPPLPRHDKRARIIIASAVIPTIALLALFAIMHWRLANAISVHNAALRSAGQPMTIDDCVKEYREHVSSPENAASAYDRAFASITNVARLGLVFPPSARRTLPQWDEEQLKIASQILQDNSRALSNVEACLNHPSAYRALEWDAGSAMLLKHLANLKVLLQLIELHAIFAIRDRDSATAIADIDHLVRAADSVTEEPLLIDVLIRERFHTVACRLMREMLSEDKLDEKQLATLAAVTARMSLQSHFVKALDFDRVTIVNAFKGSNREIQEFLDVYDMSGTLRHSTTFDITYMRFSGALKRDCLYYVECMRNIRAAAALVGRERMEAATTLGYAIYQEKRLTPVRATSVWTEAQAKYISQVFLLQVMSGFEKIVQHDAEAALTATAIAAKRFEKRTGTWPKSLTLLKDEPFNANATNPFTGAPFNFVALDDDFLILAEQRHLLPTVQTRKATEPLAIRLTKSE